MAAVHIEKGMLLDFAISSSLTTLIDEYSGQINHVSGKPKEHLGLSALLIRADGFVIWASADKEFNYASLRQVLNRWFAGQYPVK